jgi:hypothetical protein
MLMDDPAWAGVRHADRIDGRWLRAVLVPPARAFSRGYDRDATDGLLDDCADVLDELTDQLHLAQREILDLRRQALTRAARGGRSRVNARTQTARSGHPRRRRVGARGVPAGRVG